VKSSNLPSLLSAVLATALFSLACFGGSRDGGSRSQPGFTPVAGDTGAAVAPVGASGMGPGSADQVLSVREVAARIRPAVVHITNEQVALDQRNRPTLQEAGIGTGFVFDSKGYILTNYHVIEGARSLRVSLTDRRTFPAKLIGSDPETDLAVLQIEVSDLAVAPLGDSSRLAVGEGVVAIGHALDLPGGPTVTAGVVSALGRAIQEPGSEDQAGPILLDVIQTDAAINPGNSGGPLLNMAGQVIGINTLVASQAAPGVPAQGIGFAVSVNLAKRVASELMATGRVTYAYMGISPVSLTPARAEQLGVSV
jgi:S1-C subfamily serine protease